MLILIIIVIVSYVLLHTFDMASFGSRVAGRITNRAALGTTLSQTIHTLSRFLLILFLPTLGYIVESGITINDYLFGYNFTKLTHMYDERDFYDGKEVALDPFIN